MSDDSGSEVKPLDPRRHEESPVQLVKSEVVEWRGPREGFIGSVGWSYRPVMCALRDLSAFAGECDTLPDFVLIAPNAPAGIRYCHRHVMYTCQMASVMKAAGMDSISGPIPGSGAYPGFDQGGYSFKSADAQGAARPDGHLGLMEPGHDPYRD